MMRMLIELRSINVIFCQLQHGESLSIHLGLSWRLIAALTKTGAYKIPSPNALSLFIQQLISTMSHSAIVFHGLLGIDYCKH